MCVPSIQCPPDEKKKVKTKREKKENRKIEKCYFLLLAFFDEKAEISLAKLFALTGLEMNESTLGRTPACDSFETGFFDGTLRLFADPEVPCSFGALLGGFTLRAGAVERGAPPSPTVLMT